MKKLGKFLVVGAVATTVALGTVGFAACGNGGSSADYEGEYTYDITYDGENYSHYGVKVTVTIQDIKGSIKGKDMAGKDKTYKGIITDGKITKVTVEEPEGYHNITESWKAVEATEEKPLQLGYEAAKAGLNDYLKKFNGAKISEIGKIIAATDSAKGTNGVPATGSNSAQGDYIYTGATQTSGRILLAMQEAIEDWQLAAAKTSVKIMYKTGMGLSDELAQATIDAMNDQVLLATYAALIEAQG